ncbi:MAG TPA: DUF433 domain-containing protein [Planctomycetota bacterium]|nr:DUF433 domain-containing protein [Planctomycetota bacterium]
MSLVIETESPPLKHWDDGSVRVGASRVKLETIIGAHNNGDSPEEIHYSYPAVSLKDVYAVITYYLGHRESVDAYIKDQELRAAAFLQGRGASLELNATSRERLQARKAELEKQRNAATGD